MAYVIEDLKIEMTDVKSYLKKLSIDIPLEIVNKEMDVAYKEIGKNAKVQGFRKGHIPRPLLEKMFSKNIMSDVSKQLINDAVEVAVKKKELDIVSQPTIEDAKVEKGQPITFTAVVETMPKVDLPDFAAWEFAREKAEISNDMVDDFCKEIQERKSVLTPITDRPAKEGDFAMVDYTGKVDGKELKELTGKGRQVMVSGDDYYMLVDFQKKLIGMKTGEEKEFTITLPKQYPNPELTGKKADFKVTMNVIKKKKVPELTDELISSETRFKTVKEFRDATKELAEKNAATQADENLQRKIIERFEKETDFELPPSMVERYAERSWNRTIQETKASKGIDITAAPDFDETALRKVCEKEGIKDVREEIILSSVAKNEKLKIDADEVKMQMAELGTYLKEKGQKVDDKFWQANYAITSHKVFVDTVYKFILSKVKVKDKTIQNKKVEKEKK